ncbi:DEAD/DEAH box helicase [Clostridium perfringens]|uniref:DEAD/DEAH box helicase n=2 Tax=Clostridium perfringens TaxID=1502 RepID=A0AAW9JZZ6_CLOPF|nr:DEAD/DEAH box helicase [Clostridium perfringens]MDZ7541392.1 DEAD/DEAH box helicase [Clostridium perfringens]
MEEFMDRLESYKRVLADIESGHIAYDSKLLSIVKGVISSLSPELEIRAMDEIRKYKTLNELWHERGYRVSNGISLIVAPCGSGKTYFTFNTLIQGEKLENIVYLCDTSNLKRAVRLDKDYSHLCRFYSKNDDNNVVNNSIEFGEGFGENKITVMTYAQFGYYAKRNPDSFKKIKLIVMDEAHQIVDYRMKFDNEDSDMYEVAIEKIKSLSRQAKVVMLSATPELITYNKGFKVPTTYDFSNEPEIKRLRENIVIPYRTNREIKKVIKDFKKVTTRTGVKMLVYTDRIATVNDIVKTCFNEGVRAVGLWSLNNKENVMSTHQLEVLESVVKDGMIPDNIDILIINASLQTGINIKNNDIDWVLVNSTNKTTQIQARSRVRKDIDRLYLKSEDSEVSNDIELDEKWLNRPLTSNDKKELSNEIQLYDERGRLIKWKGLSLRLIEQGYKIEDLTKVIEGKRVRISIINI